MAEQKDRPGLSTSKLKQQNKVSGQQPLLCMSQCLWANPSLGVTELRKATRKETFPLSLLPQVLTSGFLIHVTSFPVLWLGEGREGSLQDCSHTDIHPHLRAAATLLRSRQESTLSPTRLLGFAFLEA